MLDIKNLEKLPIIASSAPIEISERLNLLSGIILKTITYNERKGDESNFYYFQDDKNFYSFNKIGLANLGIYNFCKNTLKNAEKILKIPIFISIYAESLKEYLLLLKEIFIYLDSNKNSNIYGIEINLSCPNIVLKNKMDVIKKITKIIKSKGLKVGYKIGYLFSDNIIFKLVQNDPDYLNCFNTLRITKENYKDYDFSEEILELITNKMPISFSSNILQDVFLEKIKKIEKYKIQIIGTGGVYNKDTINSYLKNCYLVGVGSYFVEDNKNIERIAWDFLK
jgi:dihydroorotate dehydrogenase